MRGLPFLIFPLLFPLLIACAATTPSAPKPAVQTEWSVAVMAFDDHSIGLSRTKTQGLGQMLADKFSEGLLGQANLRLIDRDSLQKVLEELSLGSSDLTDPESRLRLGKLLGANYFIMGGFTSLGESVRIDGRIVSVETGVVQGKSVEGKFSDWTTLEASLSKQLVDLLMSKVQR